MRLGQVLGLLIVVIVTCVMGYEDGYHRALNPAKTAWWPIIIPLTVVAVSALMASSF
jgi:hypothetical protein